MITELTPEQEARFEEIVDKWTKIGLNCEPIDHNSIREAVKLAYKNGGLQPPKAIYFGQSPWDIVNQAVKITGETRSNVVSSIAYGQHDAGWLAFHDYMRTVLGLTKETESLMGLFAMANAGWWIPYDEVCFVSDRPEHINRDETGRLHSINRMAIKFRDGNGMYCWHGITIPSWYIEESWRITAKSILEETNAEFARVQLEILGTDNFVRQSSAKTLHSDVDGAGQPRKLLSIEMPRDPDRMMVVCHVTCPSTGHEYILRVPPSIKTCPEAIAWTANLPVKDYAPVVER